MNLLKTYALLICTLLVSTHPNLEAQSEDPDNRILSEMSLKDHIPYIKDSMSFELLYDYLARMSSDIGETSNKKGHEVDCSSIHPTLQAFEELKAYSSLRQKQVDIECAELQAGLKAEEMSDPLIPDPILSSLFNSKGQLWVGSTIFYVKTKDLIYVVSNNDINALKAIDNGKHFNNPNIQIFRSGDSTVDFEYYILENGSVEFVFTGTKKSNESVHWDLGDGTLLSGNSVIHNYSENSSFNVCCSIKNIENGQTVTIDKHCKQIELADNGLCIFTIKKNQEEDGKVCFGLKGYLGHHAVQANWNFGDGNTSSELYPCNDYFCNKNYLVSVEGTSNKGCKFTKSINLKVSSFDCCDALASKTETVLFGEHMLKVHLYQLPLPIIGRTIVSSRHYKRKNNRYKRTKALIKNTINGNVYISDELDCKCEHPLYMNQVEQKYKSWLITNYKVGQFFQAKREDPWYGKVYINGALKYTGAVNTACN